MVRFIFTMSTLEHVFLLFIRSTLTWCWAMAVLWYQLKSLLLAFQRNASVIIRANVMITEEFWMLVSDLKLMSENSLSIYAGTNWETSLGTRPSERGSGGWKCTVHPECRRASDWKEGLGDRLGWKYTEWMYVICNYWVSGLQFVCPINVLRHANNHEPIFPRVWFQDYWETTTYR